MCRRLQPRIRGQVVNPTLDLWGHMVVVSRRWRRIKMGIKVSSEYLQLVLRRNHHSITINDGIGGGGKLSREGTEVAPVDRRSSMVIVEGSTSVRPGASFVGRDVVSDSSGCLSVEEQIGPITRRPKPTEVGVRLVNKGHVSGRDTWSRRIMRNHGYMFIGRGLKGVVKGSGILINRPLISEVELMCMKGVFHMAFIRRPVSPRKVRGGWSLNQRTGGSAQGHGEQDR